MKIIVIGGTGLIGSKLVTKLGEHGHEEVAAAPSTEVDTLTGKGLAEVLEVGAQLGEITFDEMARAAEVVTTHSVVTVQAGRIRFATGAAVHAGRPPPGGPEPQDHKESSTGQSNTTSEQTGPHLRLSLALKDFRAQRHLSSRRRPQSSVAAHP